MGHHDPIRPDAMLNIHGLDALQSHHIAQRLRGQPRTEHGPKAPIQSVTTPQCRNVRESGVEKDSLPLPLPLRALPSFIPHINTSTHIERIPLRLLTLPAPIPVSSPVSVPVPFTGLSDDIDMFRKDGDHAVARAERRSEPERFGV